MRARALFVLAAGFAATAVHPSIVSAQNGPPPAAVRVDAVRLERVQEQRLVTGDLRAVQRSRVAGEEAGLVRSIAVQQGQAVTRGQTLATLDKRRLEIEWRQAQADHQMALADLTEREADLEWRQRYLENYQTLSNEGAGRAKELYDAQMQVRIAQAKLESARSSAQAIAARVDLLAQRLQDMTILAPFNGVIIAKQVEEGEWLSAGGVVVEMLSTDSVDAWLDVPQQLAEAVLGKTPLVTVMIEATGARIETSDLRIVPLVDAKARTFAVIVRLENRDGLLAPGMSVTAYVPTGDMAERLTISRDAVMRNPTGAFVYVSRQMAPNDPPAAMPADVQPLFGAGERLVVQSPMLQPGDLLVVEGNERLFPTAPIIPQMESESAAPAHGSASTPGPSNP